MYKPAAGWLRWAALAAAVAGLMATAVLLGVGSANAQASAGLSRISSDPFTNTAGQHATEEDPDTHAYRSTVVAAFAQGLFADDLGATGIGFATSADRGETWVHGSLPAITTYTGGPFSRAVFPAVTYDRHHRTWLIASLAGTCASADCQGPPVTMAVLVSRSTDGGRTWSDPVTVAQAHAPVTLDKPSITCDTGLSSPYYGQCYIEFESHNNAGGKKYALMSVSADGGKSWGAAQGTADHATGIGAGSGTPLVRPDGTIVVPMDNWVPGSPSTQVVAFESRDGGQSWGPTHLIANIKAAGDPGAVLAGTELLSATEDAAGKIYVVWADCRFRAGCAANDIVMTTSTNGVTWGPVTRVTSGSGDNTLPGAGADPQTSGRLARIGITFYTYPQPHCRVTTCTIDVRFISSADGGNTWHQPVRVAGPMRASWLAKGPPTPAGDTVLLSDYLGTAILPGGYAITAFPLATAPSGNRLHQDMYAVSGGIPLRG
jgi:hypothetical protein